MFILRIETVKTMTGHRSKTSIYQSINDGLFPTSVLIGKRAKGWPSDEVHAINAARIGGMSDEHIRALVRKLYTQRVSGVGALCADASGVQVSSPNSHGEVAP
jgi:prophage regulatory protein